MANQQHNKTWEWGEVKKEIVKKLHKKRDITSYDDIKTHFQLLRHIFGRWALDKHLQDLKETGFVVEVDKKQYVLDKIKTLEAFIKLCRCLNLKTANEQFNFFVEVRDANYIDVAAFESISKYVDARFGEEERKKTKNPKDLKALDLMAETLCCLKKLIKSEQTLRSYRILGSNLPEKTPKQMMFFYDLVVQADKDFQEDKRDLTKAWKELLAIKGLSTKVSAKRDVVLSTTKAEMQNLGIVRILDIPRSKKDNVIFIT